MIINKTIENNSSKWKIQINMQINFISSNDIRETRTFHVWSDNKEIRQGNETNDIIKKCFESLLTNYQNEETKIGGGNFVFESVDLLSYHIHKTILKSRKSYIKSPK